MPVSCSGVQPLTICELDTRAGAELCFATLLATGQSTPSCIALQYTALLRTGCVALTTSPRTPSSIYNMSQVQSHRFQGIALHAMLERFLLHEMPAVIGNANL
jgi:hypothetical protein